MNADQLLTELRTLAPAVAFTVTRTVDPYDVWDGDAPDPTADGYARQRAELASS